jgi:hypothetical protein
MTNTNTTLRAGTTIDNDKDQQEAFGASMIAAAEAEMKRRDAAKKDGAK